MAGHETTIPPQTNASSDDLDNDTRSVGLLEVANRIYLVSVTIAAIAGASGLAATFAIYHFSKEVNAQQSTNILKLQLGIERAKLDTAAQKEKTATLQAAFSWRTITDDQELAMKKALAGKTGSICLQTSADDPESILLSNKIADVFRSSRWTVHFQSFPTPGIVQFGIRVRLSDYQPNTNVLSALKGANLNPIIISDSEVDQPGMWYGDVPQKNEIVLFVGHKELLPIQMLSQP